MTKIVSSKYRWVGAAVVVLVLGVWAMRPQAATPAEWAVNNPHLPTSFTQFAQYPIQYQRAIFRAFDVETKSRIMKEGVVITSRFADSYGFLVVSSNSLWCCSYAESGASAAFAVLRMFENSTGSVTLAMTLDGRVVANPSWRSPAQFFPSRIFD